MKIFWPYLENVYIHISADYFSARTGWTTETYECREIKGHASSTSKKTVKSQSRNTDKHTRKLCNVKIWVIFKQNQSVTVEATKKSATRHSHNLEDSNSTKLNIAIRDILAKETTHNYTNTAIRDKFLRVGNEYYRAIMSAIGGRFETRQDIANAKNKASTSITDNHVWSNTLGTKKLDIADTIK